MTVPVGQVLGHWFDDQPSTQTYRNTMPHHTFTG